MYAACTVNSVVASTRHRPRDTRRQPACCCPQLFARPEPRARKRPACPGSPRRRHRHRPRPLPSGGTENCGPRCPRETRVLFALRPPLGPGHRPNPLGVWACLAVRLSGVTAHHCPMLGTMVMRAAPLASLGRVLCVGDAGSCTAGTGGDRTRTPVGASPDPHHITPHIHVDRSPRSITTTSPRHL